MKEDIFYKKENEELYLSAAKKYAEKNGISIDKRLGSGSWGVAYLTNDGHVVKATSDPAEVYNSIQLKGKKLDNVANIYDVSYSMGNEIALIKQERVKSLGVIEEKRVKTVERKLSEGDQSFVSFDEYYIAEEGVLLTEKELHLARDIFEGINEVYDSQGVAEDLDITNIGINEKGNFVIFDQKSISIDPNDFIEKLSELKNKNKIKRKPC